MKMRFIVMRATFITDFIFHRVMRHFFINENRDQHLVPTISHNFPQFPRSPWAALAWFWLGREPGWWVGGGWGGWGGAAHLQPCALADLEPNKANKTRLNGLVHPPRGTE